MKDSIKTCKFCGKQIGIITYGIYRKVVVDADAVEVIADPEGEEDFVRIDGGKVHGREAKPGDIGAEYAYRMHGRSCGRRPS